MNRTFATVVISLCCVVAMAPAASAKPSGMYANCTNLNKTFAHGIGKATAHDHVKSGKPVTTFRKDTAGYTKAIKANKDLDRDKDGIACEKH